MSDEGWLRVNATTMILEQVDRIYIGMKIVNFLNLWDMTWIVPKSNKYNDIEWIGVIKYAI